MSPLRIPVLALFAVLWAATPQVPPGRPGEDQDVKLPDGRSQREQILKAEHERSLQDAAELTKLAEEIKAELEKNDRHVVSVGLLKKLDQMEKLTKRIRGRLRRY